MITRTQQEQAQAQAKELFHTARIPLTADEQISIEVADFGLSNLEVEGAQILTLVQTARLAVKLLALMPHQTVPEHWHPPVGEDPGKEETIRHLFGDIYCYVEGPNTLRHGSVPQGKEQNYSVRHEIVLRSGEQLTCRPGEKHWFQAGSHGAVVFSFSTVARDNLDCFTDPDVRRQTLVAEESAP